MFSETVTIALIVGFIAVIFVGGAFMYAYFVRRLSKREKGNVPYWLRNGMEDATAINIGNLIAVRDFLMILENRINDARLLLGQIRNGEYDKEQPTASRRPPSNDE